MRWVPFVLVAVVGVLLQATLMRVAVLGDAHPDLLVALLVTFGLGVEPGEGFAAGAVLGLGRDLFSIEPFGLSTAAFAVFGWAVSRRRPAATSDRFAARASFGFLCSAAASLVSVAALAAQGGAPELGLLARRTVLSAVSTAAVAALVGGLVWRRPRWFGLRRRSEFSSA